LPALVWFFLLQDPVPPRLPVPDAARLKEAEAQVRDVFKDDYARKGSSDRKLLAQKLLKNGLETADDPAARYVLLKESSSVAAQAADLPTGLRATDELAAAYQVDALPLKLTFLGDAAKGARTPEEFKPVAEAYLALLQQAVAADAFDVADQCGAAAVATARKAKDVALAARAEAKSKEVSAAKASAESVRKHRDTLARAPDDAAANLAVGRYECLLRGNWAAGLPHLGKGSDAALRELAARDLANPPDGNGQLAAGDGWWTLAEKESGEAKANAQRRAAFWYVKAREQLAGLIKQRVDLRLAQVESAGAAAAAVPKPASKEKDATLVGHWTFDEGKGMTSTGVGGSVSFVGAVSWTPGVAGGALKFEGRGAYATVADAPALNMELESFTVACAIRPNGTGIYRVVNKFQVHGNTGTGWLLDINGQVGGPPSPGFLRSRVCDGTVNVNVLVDAQLATDAWASIAMVVDRTAKELRIYADGNQVGIASLGALGSLSNSNLLGIGYVPGTPRGQFYDGAIDDVRIYRRALTPAEIKALAVRR
jgi:hypothetical protein